MPASELKRLDALVGTWNSVGRMETGPGEPPILISGTDSYEWMSGGSTTRAP